MNILKGLVLCSILFVFACSNDDNGNAGPGGNQAPCDLNVPTWLQGEWFSYAPNALDSANSRIVFSETNWFEYDIDSTMPNTGYNELCQTDSCFLAFNDASLDAATYEVSFVFADSCASPGSVLANINFQFENVDDTRVNIYAVNTVTSVSEIVSVLLKQ